MLMDPQLGLFGLHASNHVMFVMWALFKAQYQFKNIIKKLSRN